MSDSLIGIENAAKEMSLAWGKFGTNPKKRFKGAQFKKLVERFQKELFKLDWKDFAEVEHFELAEKYIELMLAITEAWVLTQYDSRHTAEVHTFKRLLEQLKTARNEVRQGFLPNPSKRPSAKDEREAELSLFRVLQPTL
jgi:hypothetical protein